MSELPAPENKSRVAWGQVTMAAVLMLATLPGRTQGLGLITEPMLKDLHLDDVSYAQLTLWAALLSTVFCLPAGRLIDRYGLRGPTVAILILLVPAVAGLSLFGAGVGWLFALILLARGLGQSALSVASITAASRASAGANMGMAVYSVLLTVFMGAAFPALGAVVRGPGWRVAWAAVAVGVLVIAVVSFFVLRRPAAEVAKEDKNLGGLSLAEALRTPVFWVFGGSIALFSLVAAGVGLFNEAVLAERGFNQEAYHNIFLPVMAITALAGQFLSGWLSRHWSLSRLLALSMFLHAGALAGVPLISTLGQMSAFAVLFGVSTGIITVVFFAVWSQAFGQAHLGRIQGAAQALTVFTSALGPLVFATTHSWWHSYTPVLLGLAPPMLAFGIAAWFLKMKVFTPER